MSNDEFKEWKAPALNKGQSLRFVSGDIEATIDHLDRTIDPYLATVILRGRVHYTGLHATVADARRHAQQIIRSLG